MEQAQTGPPDEILVVAAIVGDLDAFDILVRRYQPAVIRIARLIVPAADADDVAQESLLLAFKALPSLEEPSKFPAWLHAITRRCALRFKDRTQAQQRGCVPLDEELLRSVPALGRSAVDEGVEEDLLRGLVAIPHDYGMALRLHFLDEMPLKRIAAFLGLSLSTVKWRIFRGKRLLREQIKMQRKTESWKKKKNSGS